MTFWPASFISSITMFFRKFASETSVPSPAPSFHTLFAQFSNSRSWVTPLSRVIASYSVRPGDLWLVLGSPPVLYLTTSVVRLSEDILLSPATYLPSHLIRNLKFLYGSTLAGFTLNWGTSSRNHGRLLNNLAARPRKNC